MSCPQRSRPAAGWRVEARGRDRSSRAARGVRQAGAESVVRPPVHGAWKRGRWRRGRCGRVPGLACGVGLPSRGVAGYGGVRRCDGPGGCAAVHESAPRPASPPSPLPPPSCFVSRAPRPRPVRSSLCLVLVLLVRAVHACCQWPVLCDGVVVYERAGFFVVGSGTEMFTLVGSGSFGLLSGVFIVVVATAGAVSVCGPVPVWTSSRRGRVEGAEGHDSVLDFSVSGWRGVGVADSEMRAVGWAQSFPMSQGVRAGRRWVRGHLDSLEWAKSAPDVVDSVLLAVTELITNAHKHARSDAQLVLTWDSACLHVSVHDSSPEPPVPSDRGLDATGGRGLAIVQALSDGWEHHPQRDGKTVTACFVPPGYPAPDQALSPDGAD